MAKKHFLGSTTHEQIDKETGEIVRTEVTKMFKVNMGKTESFFMVYSDYLASFYGLKYADDIKMIIKLNEWAEFDTGEVQLSPKRRLEVTSELKIRNDSISKSLKRLREKGLISGDKGSYLINPAIFWKGERSKRIELLKTHGIKLQIDFKIDDK